MDEAAAGLLHGGVVGMLVGGDNVAEVEAAGRFLASQNQAQKQEHAHTSELGREGLQPSSIYDVYQ